LKDLKNGESRQKTREKPLNSTNRFELSEQGPTIDEGATLNAQGWQAQISEHCGEPAAVHSW
jgi:hypothetical protein